MTAPALRSSAPGAARPATGSLLARRLETELGALQARSTAGVVLASLAVAAVVLAASAFALAHNRWMTWPRALPFVAWGVAAIAAVLLARRLRSRNADVLSVPTLAGAIEREQSLRTGSLRGALEVAHDGVLGARAADDVAARLAPTALAPELAAQLLRAVMISGGAAVVAGAAFALSSVSASDGFQSVLHPMRAYQGTLLAAMRFDKLPVSVPRGMPLTVHVRAAGRTSVTVSRRAEGEAWRDTVLSIDSNSGAADLNIGPVRAPVSLRVNDGRAPELAAMVNVDERGWIGDVALFAQYPAYLGRADETLEPVSPVRVPRGTRVRVSAVLRGGVQHATLSDGATTADFQIGTADASKDGVAATAHLLLDHDGSWNWKASAAPRANGETLPPELPDSLSFVVVPDKAPEIMIASPVTDTAIATTGAVPVMIRAGDDHGVGNVVLTLWREAAAGDNSADSARSGVKGVLAKNVTAKRERIEVGDPGAPFFDGGVTIPLDARGLEAGDKLHLVAIATDDSPWRQQTSSREVILRVPTLSEQRAMARALGDSLAQRALQMAQQEKRLQQNTADASRSRELKNGGDEKSGGSKSDGQKSMSFQQAEKAKQLAKEQQQMGQKIDSLRQNAKDLENRLKSAGALDSALSNRMKDIQKMLRDAMTPEMTKQLEQLNKSTERLSGTDAQQSMEQLAQQQQQLRQQLEKSAEMLKRAALEGSMSTLRDEAKELASEQKNLANKLQNPDGKQSGQPSGEKTGDKSAQKLQGNEDPKALADRSRALKDEVDKLAKRLEEAGAKPGASKTRAAEPMVNDAADAMDKAARDALKDAREQMQKNAAEQKGQPGQQGQQQQGPPQSGQQQGQPPQSGQQRGQQGQQGQQGNQQGGQQPGQKPGQQQAGSPQAGQQGQPGQQGQGGQQGQNPGDNARKAADAMDKAAQQLANAREAQVDAWKGELSDQLDQSINETMQLARQQADLEQRARQSGNAQSMQSEQGALQQGVQQAAERLEKAGRSSSLLSQRSQKAMADAQRRVQQATQQMGQAGQPGGNEQAQNAMKDATDALNQALSSLVRDREKVNNAQSASGFTEMMEQLKQLAQKQGSLNGQMQGLNLLPGGAQGDAAKQQSRVLARQQRDVAKTLTDVSDADQTGRTDALAKEAQKIAQQIERSGVDPSVAARQQQLYRRLLDAGRFLEQDERDDQGPREAKAASGNGAKGTVEGAQSGKAGSKFAPPTWNELRGLGADERRLVIEYFRRLNGSTP